MNKKITPYIYILFFLCSFQGIFGQDLTLKLIGKDAAETVILEQLNYTKNHQNEPSVLKEVELIQKSLSRLGYFTSILEELSKEKNEYIAKFSLGTKIDLIKITIPTTVRSEYQNYFFANKDSLSMPPSEVETYIQSILLEFDKKGKSFTEVQLVNPKLGKDKTLLMELSIASSKERIINKVIVKGYEDFPNSFLQRYFKMNSNMIFSKDRLKEVSSLTKSLQFVEEIKPPEVLFKQDSTILYLFLKRVKTSSIDGIVNFASKDDGSGLLINGNLDLKLNNVLNTGEQFELFWNRVKEGNSEFKIGTRIPYLFNTNISLEANFNIYRQDSTFLNTTFRGKLDYQLNPTSNIFASISSESSDYLLDANDINFDSYSNTFWGLGYEYRKPSNSILYSNSFTVNILPSFGSRRGSATPSNQQRIEFQTEANLLISTRSYLNIKNHTATLESENFLTNELYRIGGANSIRGFNEQSIFTSRYSYINLEYRYITSLSSYLHTITDFGFFKNLTRDRTDSLLGLGLGYLFSVGNNQVNLGYAIGITQDRNLNLDNSQIIIKWASIF